MGRFVFEGHHRASGGGSPLQEMGLGLSLWAGLKNVGLPPPTWPGSWRLSSMGLCSPPSLAMQGTPPSSGLTGLGD